MFRVDDAGGLELLTCRPLDEAGVPHGFTLRRGGFGARDNQDADHARLARALGVPRLRSMRQVHGRDVRDAFALDSTSSCDGVVTDRPGLGLVVHTADCVPLLLWASDVGAVSAVHAGWRGTLAGIAEAAVERLVELGARPEALHVAIGPSIRSCCFEVGDDVVDAFVESGRERDEVSVAGPRKRHVDLVGDNLRQLESKGVRRRFVYDSGRCTACDTSSFYSYRREGKGVGRLMGAIAVRSPGPAPAP